MDNETRVRRYIESVTTLLDLCVENCEEGGDMLAESGGVLTLLHVLSLWSHDPQVRCAFFFVYYNTSSRQVSR